MSILAWVMVVLSFALGVLDGVLAAAYFNLGQTGIGIAWTVASVLWFAGAGLWLRNALDEW